MNIDDVKSQLAVLIDQHNIVFQHKATIKNWCITVWIGLIAVIATNIESLNKSNALIILATPILLFWFLEAMYGGLVYLHDRQILELENYLITPKEEKLPAHGIYFFTRFCKFTRCERIKAFFHALFRMETVFILYIILIIASILLILNLYK